MSIYSLKITCDKSSTKEETVEIEGYAITHVEILFPPGCLGLVGVSFFYGIKQIFPYEEGTDFRGSGETIRWDEYWILPELKTKIKIKVVNEDDTYQHTVYIRIVVKKREEILANQLTKSFLEAIKRMFGYVE